MIFRKTVVCTLIPAVLLASLLAAGVSAQSCSLSVTSVPDEGIISIDGRVSGTTPLGLSLPCGNHSLIVAKNGFEPYHEEVFLEEHYRKAVVANLEFRSGHGSVIIRSQPPGGTLYLDGINRGETPLQIDALSYGRHAVLIEKPGYVKFRDTITAGPGHIPEYMEYLVPEPLTGFAGFTSAPEGAEVFVDGQPGGTTPVKLERFSAGSHTALFRKTGYENFTINMNVPGGGSVLVHADLIPVLTSGSIIADSIPRGADVYLNGTFKALTPAVLENVPQGSYLLTFRKREYPDRETSVILNAGETREIFVNLTAGTGNPAAWQEQVYPFLSNTSQVRPGMNEDVPSYNRTYTWYSRGHEATVRLRIPVTLGEYYHTQPHERGAANISRYTLSERDRLYLHDLIGLLKDAGESKTYAARNDYRNVVAFVQAINYTDDVDPATNTKTDYWQYPVETLVKESGDCEDHAILAAALLKEMGYDVAVVLLEDPTKGHAAVAVACDACNGYYYPINGKKYYFLETTAYGSSLGSMEAYYEKVGADVIVL